MIIAYLAHCLSLSSDISRPLEAAIPQSSTHPPPGVRAELHNEPPDMAQEVDVDVAEAGEVVLRFVVKNCPHKTQSGPSISRSST
jgi:hypothetical protein